MKALILITVSISSYAQVTVPPIRINDSFENKVEVALCNNDSTMFFSFFQFNNAICVRQEIAFLDVTPDWAYTFAINNMGFTPGDSSLIKKIPTGFLSATIQESFVDYHGDQPAISLVIELYEFAEHEE